ncbi:MAG: RNA-binding domain-containing protein [Chloroflexota bacterium]
MAKKKSKLNWFHVDLHLHTPASMDYHDKRISYLDILKKAEEKNLDIIAFTDHNTVNGYAAMMHEIEQLAYLKDLGRATDEEQQQLNEYMRLLDKILVLPGFEFTATFGFHILGIFSPKTTIREIEHLLMNLNVPVSAIEEGNSEVGASSDVTRAYELINAAGGIVIAAHANANHGVAMRGMDFGGQTRIAYTQDPNLHCLEVTDLGSKRRYSTQRFFNGTKPEYPRKMRCIQGSDAHNLETISDRRDKVITLGVGERTTEVLLHEPTFDELLKMLKSNDFSRSRAYEGGVDHDYVQSAREEGESIIQSFHESMARRGGHMYAIIADVCAFANTNGGTVYIGASSDAKKSVAGVDKPAEAIDELNQTIGRMISPELKAEIDMLETAGKTAVVRIQVQPGDNVPYAIDEYKIYVRDENETNLAVRDEIVSLALRGANRDGVSLFNAEPAAAVLQTSEQAAIPERETQPAVVVVEPEVVHDFDEEDEPEAFYADDDMDEVDDEPEALYADEGDGEAETEDAAAYVRAAVAIAEAEADDDDVTEPEREEGDLNPLVENHALPPSERPTAPPSVGGALPVDFSGNGVPRAGVEIVGTEHRNGTNYHIMRDLRNGNIVHNVTKESARRLWHYAIRQLEENPVDPTMIEWGDDGEIGLWRAYKRGNDYRYDLVQSVNGKLRVFYGVSEAGMSGRWQQFLEPDEE